MKALASKKVKTVIQFALGILCGYLLLLAFSAYQSKAVATANQNQTPVLETVVGY
jgi:hypothetical protein